MVVYNRLVELLAAVCLLLNQIETRFSNVFFHFLVLAMLIPPKHLRELFYKYLNGQCSPREVKELLACFNAENESVLRDLITASLADMDALDQYKDEEN